MQRAQNRTIGRGRVPDEARAHSMKPRDTKKTLRRLMYYIGNSKVSIAVAFILALVRSVSTVAGSYMIRPIINDYIVPGNISGFVKMLILLACIYLTGIISSYLQLRIMAHVSLKTVKQIRDDLFSKIQLLPLKFFDKHTHGELMSRFTNDLENVTNSLNSSVTQLFSSVISVAGIVIMMLVISPLLTLISMLLIPLMIFISSRFAKMSRKNFMNQQRSLGKLNGYIEEIMQGQKEVKAFCREEETKHEFNQINQKYKKYATKAQAVAGILMPLMMNINTFNYALTATLGGLAAVGGMLDLGGLASFLQYSRQLAQPINESSNQFAIIIAAIAGAERVFEVMDELPEDEDDKNAIGLKDVQGKVVFENVTFSYDGEKRVLKNISLYAKPGQKIAFVGSTGAGKTTITNLINRFYDIQEGTITIDGINIKNIKRDSLRKSIAMVLQDTHLFTGTVMDNIRYGRPDATDEECIQAAKLASAHDFIRRLPNGYNTILTGDGSNLSQGQRQLLNIARAAVADPAILVLDEATSSIDTRTEQLIEQGMDRLMKGRTTFVIAHRLSTVRNADAIIVIENGEIIERGSHEDLIKQKGRYYRLYTGQFELE